jgi:ribose transport system permease protein
MANSKEERYGAAGTAYHALARLFASPGGRALVALVLVICMGLVFNADGAFVKIATHRDTLRQASVPGILACGMTLVIITGGIDLAVGSILALVAVMFSYMSIHWGWSPWIGVPLCLLIGGACGGISGSLISWMKIQPFIATLAVMTFARGLAKTVSGNKKIASAVLNADGTYTYIDVPAIFRAIDSRILGGNITVVSLVLAVCFLLTLVILAKHRWGRELYALGGNEEAARLSGVPVARAKFLVYVVCGMLAAVAGMCQAAQEQQGDSEAGTGYELTAIAMVVIGGTTLAGGRGGLQLTLLGILTVGYLQKVLSINAVPEASRLMLTGFIIVLAVLTQRRRHA